MPSMQAGLFDQIVRRYKEPCSVLLYFFAFYFMLHGGFVYWASVQSFSTQGQQMLRKDFEILMQTLSLIFSMWSVGWLRPSTLLTLFSQIKRGGLVNPAFWGVCVSCVIVAASIFLGFISLGSVERSEYEFALLLFQIGKEMVFFIFWYILLEFCLSSLLEHFIRVFFAKDKTIDAKNLLLFYVGSVCGVVFGALMIYWSSVGSFWAGSNKIIVVVLSILLSLSIYLSHMRHKLSFRSVLRKKLWEPTLFRLVALLVWIYVFGIAWGANTNLSLFYVSDGYLSFSLRIVEKMGVWGLAPFAVFLILYTTWQLLLLLGERGSVEPEALLAK